MTGPAADRPERPDRRAALARLGLGAAAVYFAPTVTRLDQAAAFPSCTGPGQGHEHGNGGGNGGGIGGGCGGGTANNPGNNAGGNGRGRP